MIKLRELRKKRNISQSELAKILLNYYFDGNYQDLIEAREKLKNLEKELGIDLPTLFKALKKGIYITKDVYINTFEGNHEYNSNQKYTCLVLYYSNVDDCFYLMDIKRPYGDPDSGDIGCYVKVKDYGKTWALTLEELLNE